ncbi:hypothetical protein INT48_009023 [Thamnidium elegans]|uniref:dUTP diphosphatase n=1 Tax=Thamnidium elegans TaxID=101142 RepID=A0A8H7VXU1_9FUNG|nr:hypothetical protein INT48_009023 [Thamnidium elegans]
MSGPLLVKRLSEYAQIPTRGSVLAAGYDLYWYRGDRIAQLIIEKIYTPEVVEVESLDASDRGVGGFGSTGYQ